MEKLKVRQLINGCGNLWKDLFKQNEDFNVILYFYDNGIQSYRLIEKSAWEWLEDNDYLLYYRDYDIEDWHFGKNCLFIKVYYLFHTDHVVKFEKTLLENCY